MLGLLFAVLAMQTSLNAQDQQGFWFLVAGYTGSRLLQALIWWQAISHPTIPTVMRRGTLPFVIGSLIAAFIVLITTNVTHYLLIVCTIWTATSGFEYFIPMWLY